MPDAAGSTNPEAGDKLAPPVHLQVRLELPDRPAREFFYDFQQHVISLGRDPSNDIQVPLTTVSRRHARVFYEMGDYFLEDLGSTHGTEHNGKRLAEGEKRLLRDGDSIAIMSFSIVFKTTADHQLDRKPGEKTEQLARRMVQEVLSSLGGSKMDPPALRVMNGPDEGKRFEIREEQTEVTMGRSPECDLPLNDQNISRRHCLVKRNWNGFTAQDLGSKNGVLVNGVKIEGAHNIKDGDEIQIGGVKLIFIDPPSRLLDQFGGLNAETMEPRDQHGANGVADASSDLDPSIDAAAGGLEHPADLAPEMDIEPEKGAAAEVPAEPDAPVLPDFANDPELQAASAAAHKVAGRGVGWEMIILIVGAVFLIGAIGLTVFLVM